MAFFEKQTVFYPKVQQQKTNQALQISTINSNDAEFLQQNSEYNFLIEDQSGFDEMQYITESFELKSVEMPGFPYEQEAIKILEISNNCYIIISEDERIFRWRINEEPVFQEYGLPNYAKNYREKILRKIDSKVKKIKKFVAGKTFIDSYRQDQVVDKVFLNNSGDHCLLSNNDYENYYFNIHSKVIEVVQRLNDYNVTCASWDDRQPESNIKFLLAGTDDSQIVLVKFELKNNQYKDQNVELLLKINLENQKILHHLKIIDLHQQIPQSNVPIIYSMVIASTNASIFYFMDSSVTKSVDLNQIFVKYQGQNNDAVREGELPLQPSHKSYMDICYHSKTNRPISIIWTNGQCLINIKFPNENEKITENTLKKIQYLRYQKGYDSNPKDIYSIDEFPLGICKTENHYFILHKDSMSIMSSIMEQLVKFIDLKDFQEIQGMILDRNSECIWLYTDCEIKKVSLENNDQNVWLIYKEAGKLKEAYESCKQCGIQKEYQEYMAGLYADDLYKKKRYTEAIKLYMESNYSFEYIFLRFCQSQNLEIQQTLDTYLMSQFKKYDKLEQINKDQYKVQKILLLSWIVELKINMIQCLENKIQSSNIQKDIHIINLSPEEEQLFGFFSYEKCNQFLQLTEQLQMQDDQSISETMQKLTEIQKQEQQKQLESVKSNLNEFLKVYGQNINEEIVYQIMQSHGKIDSCVDFLEYNKRYEMIIIHYINEEKYDEMLKYFVLQDQKKMSESFYKYCHILMEHRPKQASEILLNKIKKFDPDKILSSLYNIPQPITQKKIEGLINEPNEQQVNQSEDERIYGLKILEYCINKANKDKKTLDQSIHNTFVYFAAQLKQEDKLVKYFIEQENKNQYLQQQQQQQQQQIQLNPIDNQLNQQNKFDFNFDLALRICQNNENMKAIVQLYGIIGIYSEGINIALENNLIDLAQDFARKISDESQMKKIWMQIILHMLKGDGTNSAVKKDQEKEQQKIQQIANLIKDIKCIKIDDIIPYFDPNMKIELLKDQICESLVNYNKQIDELKNDIDKISKKSDALRKEQISMKNQYIEFSQNKKCEECKDYLLSNDYYIFPCLHGFHKDCLIRGFQKIYDENSDELQAIAACNEKIQYFNDKIQKSSQKKSSSSKFWQIFNKGSFDKQQNKDEDDILSKQEMEQFQRVKKQFDDKISCECLYCGFIIVESVEKSFDLSQKEKDSWNL